MEGVNKFFPTRCTHCFEQCVSADTRTGTLGPFDVMLGVRCHVLCLNTVVLGTGIIVALMYSCI